MRTEMVPCATTVGRQGARGGHLPRRQVLVVLCTAVVVLGFAAGPAPTAAYGIGSRSVDGFGRLTSLRFLHIPKTGTSFIIMLRNYLTACRDKDLTCAGKRGGTNPAYLFPDDVTKAVESCQGHLIACDFRYHASFDPSPKWNYATLLREPVQHATSGFFYTNMLRRANNQTEFSVQQYTARYRNLQTKMLGGVYLLTGVDDVDMPNVLARARENLNSTVFFGVSDHWNTTVCLFHKELRGPGPRPSEFVNARKNGDKQELTGEELEVIRDSVHFDSLLFEEAYAHFQARAAAYNCDMV